MYVYLLSFSSILLDILTLDFLSFYFSRFNLSFFSRVFQGDLSVDVLEAHRANQDMVVNTGVLEDLLSMLHKPFDPRRPSSVEMFRQLFILLRVLALRNNMVQKRLFDRVDLLLSLPTFTLLDERDDEALHVGCSAVLNERANTVAEIFTNGKVQAYEHTHIYIYTNIFMQFTSQRGRAFDIK